MPALASSQQVNGDTNATTSLVSSAISVANGDLIVVKTQTADASLVISTPTGGSQTWTKHGMFGLPGEAPGQAVSYCIVTGNPGTVTVTQPFTGTAHYRSMVVEKWTGAGVPTVCLSGSTGTGGAGGPGAPNGTTTSVKAGSYLSWVCGDISPVAPTGVTYRSGATQDGLHDQSGGFPGYVGYYATQPVSVTGSQTVGLSAPGAQIWQMVAVEIPLAPPGIVHYTSAWAGNAETGAARTSASFTPAANCKLYAFAYSEPDSAFTTTITDSLGSPGWTVVADSGDFSNPFTQHTRLILWELAIGASPSARTVTITNSVATGEIAYGIFAVTGQNPRIKPGQVVVDFEATGAPPDGTLVVGDLPVAAQVNNLTVVIVGANKDTSTAVPTPSGFSVLFANSDPANRYEAPACFYRWNFSGVSTTVLNTGDSSNSYAAMLLEFEEAEPPSPGAMLWMEPETILMLEDGTVLLTEGAAEPFNPLTPKYVSDVKTSGTTAALTNVMPALNVGDIVVVNGAVATSNPSVVGTGVAAPTLTGVSSWTRQAQQPSLVSTNPYAVTYTGVVTTAQAAGNTLSGHVTLASDRKSMLVEVWDGNKVALDATPQTVAVNGGPGAPSQSFTTEDADSVITYVIVDWTAIPGLPVHGANANAEGYDWVSGQYGAYYAFINNPGAAGSETISMSSPPGQDWVVCGVELLRI